MRPTSHDDPLTRRRAPKSFRLLASAIALADECAREMIANLEAPHLATTGDRIERVEHDRRELASALEDHLRGALLSPFDPADLHGFSASIASLTHRTGRALYFFGLLGPHAPPAELRLLVQLLADQTSELVRAVDDLVAGRTSGLAARARTVRKLRDEAHAHSARVIAMTASRKDSAVLLWRTVGEAVDVAAGHALAVADESLRLATKND